MPELPVVPSPDTELEKKLSKFQLAANASGQFIALTSKEWLFSLLNQPTVPPFKFDADFNGELNRVVRLIVAVLTISGVLVGGVNLLVGKFDPTETFKYAIIVFVTAIFITLIYTPFFWVFGVRKIPKTAKNKKELRPLTIAQVFYAILLTFVPWIPILVFIDASVSVTERPFLIDFLLIAPFLCLVYMLVNLAKSVRLLTNCSWFRIWLSILAPFLIVFLYSAI